MGYKPPKSIEGLNREAISYNFSTKVPFTTWLRSAKYVLKIAKEHDSERQYPEAYLFYKRFQSLILESIPSHPEFTNRSSFIVLSNECNWVQERCKKLEGYIARERINYENKVSKKSHEPIEQEKRRGTDASANSGEDKDGNDDGTGNNNADNSFTNTESVINVAMAPESMPFKRDFSDLSTNTGFSIGNDEFGGIDLKDIPKFNVKSNKVVNQPMENEHLDKLAPSPSVNVEHVRRDESDDEESDIEGDSVIDNNSDMINDDNDDDDDDISETSFEKIKAPEYNSPQKADSGVTMTPLAPPIIDAINCSPISPQRRPKIKSVEEIKSLHASSNKSSVDDIDKAYRQVDDDDDSFGDEDEDDEDMFGEFSFTENGIPLKAMHVPFDIKKKFLEVSKRNTEEGIETCGILGGNLVKNKSAFQITDLIIPKQRGTSNTCYTTSEEQLLQFVDEKDLFILGWIHTHPTQPCFLSSVDLHTHCGYQLQLPESIAIVLAPNSSTNFGIFRLTESQGMPLITKCKERGFHPHKEDSLYDTCTPSSGSHVTVEKHLPLKVTDLRI